VSLLIASDRENAIMKANSNEFEGKLMHHKHSRLHMGHRVTIAAKDNSINCLSALDTFDRFGRTDI